jgi:hypothetical protein
LYAILVLQKTFGLVEKGADALKMIWFHLDITIELYKLRQGNFKEISYLKVEAGESISV